MDDIELANQADMLSQNPAYKRAMEGVRMALVARLEETPIQDHALQHEIALSLQILKQVDRHIRSFIQTGEIERRREEEKRKWYEMRRKAA